MSLSSTEEQSPFAISALAVLRAQVESQNDVEPESGLAARRTLFALAGGSQLPSDIDSAMRRLSEFERAILERHPADVVESRRREILAALDDIVARSHAS